MTNKQETKVQVEAAGFSFEIEGLGDRFAHTLTPLPETTAGVVELELKLTADPPVKPAPTKLTWRVPMDRIHYKWNPSAGENRYLDVTSGCKNSFKARGIDSAPVMALYDIAGDNALTFAISDAMHASEMGIRVGEDGFVTCRAQIFCEGWDAIGEYSVILRIDRRRLPYHVCLRDTAAWWDALIERPPASVPDAARLPLFCTWYSHHAKFTFPEVTIQALLAKDLGMDVLLVDAGWGPYDGKPTAESHPEMFAMIRSVHAAGMKVMLWSSPWSLTDGAKAIAGDRVLVGPNSDKGRVDPRYPDIREHIVEAYEYLMRECGVDGFKIDFISSLAPAAIDEPDDDRRDTKSVSEGADRCLQAVSDRLRAINPDAMLEYRQSYVGPHMLRHGTMFRAVDCGNCLAVNRLRTLDIRLLSGKMPAHADPIMWNPCEEVAIAAAHLTHTLLAVPQVSVRFDELPADHTEMLRTYLRFWKAHRDVILDGELTPHDPQAGFPVVLSATADKLLAAVFARVYIPLPADVPGTLLIVNGTLDDHVILEAAGDLGTRRAEILTCTGETVTNTTLTIPAGVHRLDVPPNGYATLRAL